MKVELMFLKQGQPIKLLLQSEVAINQEQLIKLEIQEILAQLDYINLELDLEFINLDLDQPCLNQELDPEQFIKLELQELPVLAINLEQEYLNQEAIPPTNQQEHLLIDQLEPLEQQEQQEPLEPQELPGPLEPLEPLEAHSVLQLIATTRNEN